MSEGFGFDEYGLDYYGTLEDVAVAVAETATVNDSLAVQSTSSSAAPQTGSVPSNQVVIQRPPQPVVIADEDRPPTYRILLPIRERNVDIKLNKEDLDQ